MRLHQLRKKHSHFAAKLMFIHTPLTDHCWENPKVSKVLSLSATSIEAWSYFVFPSLPSNSPNMSKAHTEWMERHQMVSSSHLIGTSHSQETSSTNSSFTCKSCHFAKDTLPWESDIKPEKGHKRRLRTRKSSLPSGSSLLPRKGVTWSLPMDMMVPFYPLHVGWTEGSVSSFIGGRVISVIWSFIFIEQGLTTTAMVHIFCFELILLMEVRFGTQGSSNHPSLFFSPFGLNICEITQMMSRTEHFPFMQEGWILQNEKWSSLKISKVHPLKPATQKKHTPKWRRKTIFQFFGVCFHVDFHIPAFHFVASSWPLAVLEDRPAWNGTGLNTPVTVWN